MVEFDITTASNQLTDTILNGDESISYREIRISALPVLIKAWFHMGVESWYAQEYKWIDKQRKAGKIYLLNKFKDCCDTLMTYF